MQRSPRDDQDVEPSTSAYDTSASLIKRLVTTILRAWQRFEQRSPRSEAIALGLALAAFVAASILGFAALPPVETGGRWRVLLPALTGVVLATAFVNGLEFRLTARLLGTQAKMAESLRVSVIGSAANLLPIPGSVLIRVRALRQLGHKRTKAFAATATVGLTWVALGALIAGGFLLAAGQLLAGATFLSIGVVSMGIAVLVAPRSTTRTAERNTMAAVVAVEVVSVLLAVVRMRLVLGLLIPELRWEHAAALAATAIVSTATGIFPGGLGLREALSAGVGSWVGLPASVGVAAAAIDRLVLLVVLAVVSAGIVVIDRGGKR